MSYTFFFYNSHSLKIKDLQPWTKCSHNSDDIQHMAIFSGYSDVRHIFQDMLSHLEIFCSLLFNLVENMKSIKSTCRPCEIIDLEAHGIHKWWCWMSIEESVVDEYRSAFLYLSILDYQHYWWEVFSKEKRVSSFRAFSGVSDLSRDVGLVYVCLLLNCVGQIKLILTMIRKGEEE